MRLIDLSLEMAPSKSEPIPVEIEYIDHVEGGDMLGKPAGIDHKHFPENMALSLEKISLTSHSGTHVDAPLHYGPISGGQKSQSISEVPLEWFFSDGVVIDCTDISSGIIIKKNEIVNALVTMNYSIKENDIVLIHTGADKKWGSKEYLTNFRGMSKEATEFLVEQGVKVIGIDTFGFDAPFEYMLSKYLRTSDKNYLWPAHFYGREKPYCQIERLVNIHKIPQKSGFKVSCFPIKIKDAGAGWSRVVAIVEDD